MFFLLEDKTVQLQRFGIDTRINTQPSHDITIGDEGLMILQILNSNKSVNITSSNNTMLSLLVLIFFQKLLFKESVNTLIVDKFCLQ